MNPLAYGGAFGQGSGNLLEDPVIPAVSGVSVIKIAVTLGVFLWMIRSLGRGGK